VTSQSPLPAIGDEVAEFFVLTAEQMRGPHVGKPSDRRSKTRPGVVATGRPSFLAFGGGEVAVWGRNAA
jgi:hypothetical protein